MRRASAAVPAVLGTVHVRTVRGRDRGGRAAVRQRGVGRRDARPVRRVPGPDAVRRHTVRVRGPGRHDRAASVLPVVRPGAGGVRRAVRVHARVARTPGQRGPRRGRGRGVEVSISIIVVRRNAGPGPHLAQGGEERWSPRRCNPPVTREDDMTSGQMYLGKYGLRVKASLFVY